MGDATAKSDLDAPQTQAVPKDDLSLTITTSDLSSQPNNPFQGKATITGQMGTPIGILVTGAAATIPPITQPTSSGNDWTFTFGSGENPVAAGDYLFTVRAVNASGSKTQTIAVKLSS